ncbi:rod shape-determining protein [Salmonella enterica subsp. enterica]|uniref:Rod shape-determining protein n=1 Tax=Salmonella enterica I TaxID=59201 RepID=A0A447N352_SALET|nr:rod shape-determining protein [Salmonella enterica subsp. enterica]
MTPEEVHRVANERLMQMMPQVLPSPDAMGPPAPVPDRRRGLLNHPAGQTAPVSTQPSPSGATTPPARAPGG